MKKKTLLSWSSGKDSAWSLYQLQQDPAIDLAGLFCTVNEAFGRVAMHGVRVELLQKQAECAGLPLEIIELPYPCSNEAYETIMGQFIEKITKEGIEYTAFGDLYLEDIRRYREEKLAGTGIEPIFPLWGKPTDQLARQMLASGLKSLITCVDSKQISPEFAGREWDASLLEALPETADPCGENGEFHSFVFAGPMFRQAIDVEVGTIEHRDGFVFADVLPS